MLVTNSGLATLQDWKARMTRSVSNFPKPLLPFMDRCRALCWALFLTSFLAVASTSNILGQDDEEWSRSAFPYATVFTGNLRLARGTQ